MFANVLLLAADPTPWYQALEFWAIFLGVLGSSIAGTWAVVRFIYRERIHNLKEEKTRLQDDLRDATAKSRRMKSAEDPKRDELQQKLANSRHANEELREELTESQEVRERLIKTLATVKERLLIARQQEGMTWKDAPTKIAAPFAPLAERQAPIVAVLNLKGGVGKTTVAANLGAAFARTGRRVLLIDLDLQASLTTLFIAGEPHQQLARNQRLIQDYFEQSLSNAKPRFLDFVHDTPEHGVDLVGSADTLAYAELNLTVHWLLKMGKKDARLLLREALHESECTRRFDLILIDCPPLLNVSCVNALAAADYLLIPIMPSKQVTDRVQPMLHLVRELRQKLNPDLQILGVIANRTYRSSGLSGDESNLWSTLRDRCHETWTVAVHMCQTFIPQNADIRDAENERRPLKVKDGTFVYFRRLAEELAGRLPHLRPPTNRAPVAGVTS